MGRFSTCIALLLVSFTSHAWEIDNQTAFPLIVTRSIYTAALVIPSSMGTCSHLVPPKCVESSDSETQRNELVILNITADLHSCTVRVAGDGLVKVKFNSLNQFRHDPANSIPDEFTCEGSAEFNTLTPTNMSCPYTVADPYYEADPGQGYLAHLLHEEPDHTLAAFAVAWLPGRGAPPHDHGTWAVVAGVEGVEHNTRYKCLDDKSRSDYAELQRGRSPSSIPIAL